MLSRVLAASIVLGKCSQIVSRHMMVGPGSHVKTSGVGPHMTRLAHPHAPCSTQLSPTQHLHSTVAHARAQQPGRRTLHMHVPCALGTSGASAVPSPSPPSSSQTPATAVPIAASPHVSSMPASQGIVHSASGNSSEPRQMPTPVATAATSSLPTATASRQAAHARRRGRPAVPVTPSSSTQASTSTTQPAPSTDQAAPHAFAGAFPSMQTAAETTGHLPAASLGPQASSMRGARMSRTHARRNSSAGGTAVTYKTGSSSSSAGGSNNSGSVASIPASSLGEAGEPGPVLLIDGLALAHRSWHGLKNTPGGGFRTSDGTPTNITAGVLKTLTSIIKDLQPRAVLVAFDAGASFRKELAGRLQQLQQEAGAQLTDDMVANMCKVVVELTRSGSLLDKAALTTSLRNALPPALQPLMDSPVMASPYKAGRPSLPDGFKQDLHNFMCVLQALRIPYLALPHIEADDTLAALAQAAAEQGERVKIVTGDQDLLQLVDDTKNISVMLANNVNKGKQAFTDMHEADVVAKHNVKPSQFADYRALRGDSSDGIPGVRGIGPVGAQQLFKEHNSLDDIYAALDRVPPVLAKKLVDGRKDAAISRLLSTLGGVRVDLGQLEQKFKLQGFVKAEVQPLLEQLELREAARSLDTLQALLGGEAAKPLGPEDLAKTQSLILGPPGYVQGSTETSLPDEELLPAITDPLFADATDATDLTSLTDLTASMADPLLEGLVANPVSHEVLWPAEDSGPMAMQQPPASVSTQAGVDLLSTEQQVAPPPPVALRNRGRRTRSPPVVTTTPVSTDTPIQQGSKSPSPVTRGSSAAAEDEQPVQESMGVGVSMGTDSGLQGGGTVKGVPEEEQLRQAGITGIKARSVPATSLDQVSDLVDEIQQDLRAWQPVNAAIPQPMLIVALDLPLKGGAVMLPVVGVPPATAGRKKRASSTPKTATKTATKGRSKSKSAVELDPVSAAAFDVSPADAADASAPVPEAAADSTVASVPSILPRAAAGLRRMTLCWPTSPAGSSEDAQAVGHCLKAAVMMFQPQLGDIVDQAVHEGRVLDALRAIWSLLGDTTVCKVVHDAKPLHRLGVELGQQGIITLPPVTAQQRQADMPHWELGCSSGVRMPLVDTLLAAYISEPGLAREKDDQKNTQALAVRWETPQSKTLFEMVQPEDASIADDEDVAEGRADKALTTAVTSAAAQAAQTYGIAGHLMRRKSTASLPYDPRTKEVRKAPTAAGWKLLEDLEQPLQEVLANVENTGVLINKEHLDQVDGDTKKRMIELESEVKALSGKVAFNMNAAKDIGDLLYAKLKVQGPDAEPPKTPSGQFSTDAETLEKFKDAHPAVRLIMEYKQLFSMDRMYIAPQQDALKVSHDGRVRTNFQQNGAITGRFSSVDPNLQAIPVRSPTVSSVRAMFIPRPGWKIMSVDYSQMELRVMAALCGEPNLVDAYNNNDDVHRKTAQLVFALDSLDKVTERQRQIGKQINFGVIYGMGAKLLASKVGNITDKEAKSFIERFYETYPYVNQLMRDNRCKAVAQGYVETAFGRRRYFDFEDRSLLAMRGQDPANVSLDGKLNNRDGDRLRAAGNAPIQGTAADLMKQAMVRTAAALRARGLKSCILLTVHDELVLEIAPGEESEVEQLAVRCMEGADDGMLKAVPLKAEVSIKNEWA